MNAKDIAAKLEEDEGERKAMDVQKAVSIAAVAACGGDYAALCSGTLSMLVLAVATMTTMPESEFADLCRKKLREAKRITDSPPQP